MFMSDKRTTQQIIGLGAISGLRTMSGPAFLARSLKQDPPARWPHPLVHQLGTEPSPTLVQLMAAGELMADKLPFIPARIKPEALAGRAMSGAFVGVTLSLLKQRSPLVGALLGGAAAVLAAFAGYHARRRLTVDGPLPDFVVALLEDGLVLALGTQLTRKV
jgi:uncharacterized membrane protein